MFQLIIVILSIAAYNTIVITFVLYCDDRCNYIFIDDKMIIENNVYNYFRYQLILPYIENFQIILENHSSELYIQGTIDFNYFIVNTDNFHKNLWTVGAPNENCHRITPIVTTEPNGIPKIKVENDGTLNSAKCTCFFEICHNIYFLPPPTTTEHQISYFINLSPEYRTFFITYLVPYIINQYSSYYINGVQQTNTIQVIDTDLFSYTTDTNYVQSDTFKLDFYDGIEKVMECKITFVVCNQNCEKCNIYTKICEKCKSGYAFKIQYIALIVNLKVRYLLITDIQV